MNKIHDNKVAIITGARSGLGLAVTQELLAQGARVTLVARSADKLQATADELVAEYGEDRILAVAGDVTSDEDAQNIVDQTLEKFGTIDYLVNNAGVEGPNQSITDYDMDAYRKVIDINLNGAMNMINRVGKVMKEKETGSIVNISSTAGKLAVDALVGYTASKHGLLGLTKQAALELGPFGVRTNAVAPGGTLTDMLEGFVVEEAEKAGISEEEMEANITSSVPMGRFGRPEEQAYAVSFLLSDYASFINGENLTVDGGQTARLPI